MWKKLWNWLSTAPLMSKPPELVYRRVVDGSSRDMYNSVTLECGHVVTIHVHKIESLPCEDCANELKGSTD